MTPAVNRTMSAPEWAMLLSLSVLWGGSFFFTHVALSALPPFTLVVLRVGLAALILNAIVPLAGSRMPRESRVRAAFLGMGLLNNVAPFCLIVWGQTHIASGLAAILNATTPLFTVAAAHALTSDERMTGNRLAGVLIGLGGVVVMVGPVVLAGLGTDLLAQVARPRRGRVLRLCRHLRAALPAHGRSAHSDGCRASHGVGAHAPTRRPHRGSTLDLSDPGCVGVGCGPGHRGTVDSARLCALLSHPGERRSDEPPSRHLPSSRCRPPRSAHSCWVSTLTCGTTSGWPLLGAVWWLLMVAC